MGPFLVSALSLTHSPESSVYHGRVAHLPQAHSSPPCTWGMETACHLTSWRRSALSQTLSDLASPCRKRAAALSPMAAPSSRLGTQGKVPNQDSACLSSKPPKATAVQCFQNKYRGWSLHIRLSLRLGQLHSIEAPVQSQLLRF